MTRELTMKLLIVITYFSVLIDGSVLSRNYHYKHRYQAEATKSSTSSLFGCRYTKHRHRIDSNNGSSLWSSIERGGDSDEQTNEEIDENVANNIGSTELTNINTTDDREVTLVAIHSSQEISNSTIADETSLNADYYRDDDVDQVTREQTLDDPEASLITLVDDNINQVEVDLSNNNIIQDKKDSNNDDDNERYSRQVYTLGIRAHSRIRNSTVYIDGPTTSGLLYECAKNLALSGVRNIIFIRNQQRNASDSNDNIGPSTDVNDDNNDINYHNSNLDDLGQMYIRGAQAEIHELSNKNDNQDDSNHFDELLHHYLQRLNPNIAVSLLGRHEFLNRIEITTVQGEDDNKQHNIDDNSIFLCIDRSYDKQMYWNDVVRSKGIKFVSVETVGIFGRLFNDFHCANNKELFEVYDSDGETPANTPLKNVGIVASSEINDTQATIPPKTSIDIYCVDGEKHDVSKGDIIQFQYKGNGTTSTEHCIVTDVKTPFHIIANLLPESNNLDSTMTLNDIESFVTRINSDAASFQRIKVSTFLAFISLQDAMNKAFSKFENNNDVFATFDLEKSFDIERRYTSMICFQALSYFVSKHSRLPNQESADKTEFGSCIDKIRAKYSSYLSLNDKIVAAFVATCSAKFSPMQCIFGAIAAQEVLKAITGLYYPVKQFLLYDCDEVLVKSPEQSSAKKQKKEKLNNNEVKSPGLRRILGDKVVDKLQKKKLFVVGAGAIGCEILKNLASMGAGTGQSTKRTGKVITTDMDTIEKSNLSRQLLFRDCDLGNFKSFAAREACTRLEADMKIEAHSAKVGMNDDTPFDDLFWSKGVDIVLNALDNLDARLYMDECCVRNKKSLIDAGTMGPKGNVQVIIPNLSESYASSVDPPEPSIPLCTIKDFPYVIAHTIQWGRDLFDQLYTRRPERLNDFMMTARDGGVEQSVSKLFDEMSNEMTRDVAAELSEDIGFAISNNIEEIHKIRQSALSWAGKLCFTLFFKTPADMLVKHPIDSVDDEGEKFWTGTRNPPTPLHYISSTDDPSQQIVNQNLVTFVANAARLRVELLVGAKCKNEHSSFSSVEASEILSMWPPIESTVSSRHLVSPVDQVRNSLSNTTSVVARSSVVEFEKDDETNGHVAFVTAASNLRAISYSIPPIDESETRRVAGRIVPAMITTTAIVSALASLELIKVVQNAALRQYRNAFINLALPFFALTIPLEAESIPGLAGNSYTIWDRLIIKEKGRHAVQGGMRMKSVLSRIRNLSSDEPGNVSVMSVSFGPYVLYADFLHENDKDRLQMPIWDLIKDAIAEVSSFDTSKQRSSVIENLHHFDKNAILNVVVVDNEIGDEIELPPIHILRFIEK